MLLIASNMRLVNSSAALAAISHDVGRSRATTRKPFRRQLRLQRLRVICSQARETFAKVPIELGGHSGPVRIPVEDVERRRLLSQQVIEEQSTLVLSDVASSSRPNEGGWIAQRFAADPG
jgi:hypothetical protein